MTATDRSHLTYPDTDRLKARLADAQAARLILFDHSEREIDPFEYEYTTRCTPTEKLDAYDIFIRWSMIEDRVFAHCSCTAGSYGTACRHLALALDQYNLIAEDVQVMVMDTMDWQRYETLALLPTWKGD